MRKDAAFLTNIIGIEMLSFAIYAIVDPSFNGWRNTFIVVSTGIFLGCLVSTLVLLEVGRLVAKDKARFVVGLCTEVGVSLLPAALTSLHSGNVRVGVVYLIISIVSSILFIKYIAFFKRMFFD